MPPVQRMGGTVNQGMYVCICACVPSGPPQGMIFVSALVRSVVVLCCLWQFICCLWQLCDLGCAFSSIPCNVSCCPPTVLPVHGVMQC